MRINKKLNVLHLILKHKDVLVRVIADIVFINVAVLISMIIRFIHITASGIQASVYQ